MGGAVSRFDYVIPCDATFKALVISDIHIGQYHDKEFSMDQVVDRLRRVVDLEHPTVIFILGDIIHVNLLNRTRHWVRFYEKLETLNVETHIIPGNHDRWKHSGVCSSFHGTNVHAHNDDVIVVTRDGDSGSLAVLGHDLKYDKRVHSESGVRKWYTQLRTRCAHHIPPDSLLILGHLHQLTDSVDGKTMSILPFSYDLRIWGYGVLEEAETDGNRFSFTRRMANAC